MLVRLHHDPQHLRRLQALLIDKLQPDIQKLGERMLHDFIELIPLLPTLEPIHPANRQQTLQARVDGIGVIGAQ